MEVLGPTWDEYQEGSREMCMEVHYGRMIKDQLKRRDADNRKRLGMDEGLNIEHQSIVEAVYEKVERVMDMPAHTVKGLAVHAIAAEYMCRNLFSKPEDELDWDERLIRNLIEQVQLTGDMLWSG